MLGKYLLVCDNCIDYGSMNIVGVGLVNSDIIMWTHNPLVYNFLGMLSVPLNISDMMIMFISMFIMESFSIPTEYLVTFLIIAQ